MMDSLVTAIDARIAKVDLRGDNYAKLGYYKPLNRRFRGEQEDIDESAGSDADAPTQPPKKRAKTDRGAAPAYTHMLQRNANDFRFAGIELIPNPWQSMKLLQDSKFRKMRATPALIARGIKAVKNLHVREHVDINWAGKACDYDHDAFKKSKGR